jgi:hypothetical protein
MQVITAIGVFAKSVFQVHGMSQMVHYSGIGQSPIQRRGAAMTHLMEFEVA